MRTRVIDQNASHHLRGDRKKVCSALPGDVLLVHNAKKSFMDQGGRLQGMVRAFLAHGDMGHAAQFVVNQRDETKRRLLIAIAPLAKQLGDVGRGGGHTSWSL